MKFQKRFNIKITLAYDGGHYLGWQKTAMGPSIEASLESALCKILQEPVFLQAASRTDAGVHATNQIVNFTTQQTRCLKKLLHSLNGLLPKNMVIKQIEYVDDDFHPTIDCLSKEYHYYVFDGQVQLPFRRHYVWHHPYRLDVIAMRTAALKFIGKHDFSAFCNSFVKNEIKYENCEREIYTLDILHQEEEICFKVCGNNFLYKMVRNMVGTIVHIGCGKIEAKNLDALMANKKRTQIGVTAPAHGLYLHEVRYK